MYLAAESGLSSFFCFSLFFLILLSSAQNRSHLTHKLPHLTSSPVGHIQFSCCNIHMAIPGPLLLFHYSSLLFHFLSSWQSSTCRLTWSLTPTLSQTNRHSLTSVHAQTEGKRGDFARCWGERKGATDEGGKTM